MESRTLGANPRHSLQKTLDLQEHHHPCTRHGNYHYYYTLQTKGLIFVVQKSSMDLLQLTGAPMSWLASKSG